jgi:hypothetical protein
MSPEEAAVVLSQHFAHGGERRQDGRAGAVLAHDVPDTDPGYRPADVQTERYCVPLDDRSAKRDGKEAALVAVEHLDQRVVAGDPSRHGPRELRVSDDPESRAAAEKYFRAVKRPDGKDAVRPGVDASHGELLRNRHGCDQVKFQPGALGMRRLEGHERGEHGPNYRGTSHRVGERSLTERERRKADATVNGSMQTRQPFSMVVQSAGVSRKDLHERLSDHRGRSSRMSTFNACPSPQDTETETGGVWDAVQMGFSGAYYFVRLDFRLRCPPRYRNGASRRAAEPLRNAGASLRLWCVRQSLTSLVN